LPVFAPDRVCGLRFGDARGCSPDTNVLWSAIPSNGEIADYFDLVGSTGFFWRGDVQCAGGQGNSEIHGVRSNRGSGGQCGSEPVADTALCGCGSILGHGDQLCRRSSTLSVIAARSEADDLSGLPNRILSLP